MAQLRARLAMRGDALRFTGISDSEEAARTWVEKHGLRFVHMHDDASLLGYANSVAPDHLLERCLKPYRMVCAVVP
jgi:hypothetical protein